MQNALQDLPRILHFVNKYIFHIFSPVNVELTKILTTFFGRGGISENGQTPSQTLSVALSVFVAFGSFVSLEGSAPAAIL